MRRSIRLLLVALVASVVMPTAASANTLFFSHYASSTSGGIGKVGFDGTGLDDAVATTNPRYPEGVAATDSRVYYLSIQQSNNAVDLVATDHDGSNPSTLGQPCSTSQVRTTSVSTDLAVNATHVYYVCTDGISSFSIGRMGLDGSGQNDDFIDLGSAPMNGGLAVNATHAYFFTAYFSELARVALAAGSTPTTVSVDAISPLNRIALTSTHVYWTKETGGSDPEAVMRADLDLTGATVVVTPGNDPYAVAVSDSYIFWASVASGTQDRISRSDLDGSNVIVDFVPASARGKIPGLAVAVAAAASNQTLTVERSGSGAGTITSDPAGIDCGAACSADFTNGASVTLTATATAGSSFSGWDGACSGTEMTCTVAMDAAKSVTATFVARAVTIRSRTTTTRGVAKVRVRVPAAGTLRMVGSRTTTRRVKGNRQAARVRVCSSVKRTTKASTVTVYCVPNRATRTLLQKRKVRVTLRFTFTTSAGTTTTKSVRITLPKRTVNPRPVTG